MAFVGRANRIRYGRMIEETDKKSLKGKDKFPKTLVDPQNLLVNNKNDLQNSSTHLVPISRMAFSQSYKFSQSDKGIRQTHNTNEEELDISKIKCLECKEMAHYSIQCAVKKARLAKEKGQKFLQIGIRRIHF